MLESSHLVAGLSMSGTLSDTHANCKMINTFKCHIVKELEPET